VSKGVTENKIFHLLGLVWLGFSNPSRAKIKTTTFGFALVVDWQIHDREHFLGNA